MQDHAVLRTSPAFSERWPIPRYGTVKYGKHSISFLGPYLSGKISQDIRSKTSLGSFVGTVCNLDVSSLLDGSCNCCACTKCLLNRYRYYHTYFLLSYVYILLDLYFDFMILFSVPN